MLVRAFRLTDKLGNALLRCLIWIFDGLIGQTYRLRLSLFNFLSTVWFFSTSIFRSGRSAYASNLERRRAIMARRAEEQATRTIVREDPLKTQNRALSLFTIVLLLMLIALVIWTTSNTNRTGPNIPQVAGGPLPIEPTRPSPTPTITPTSTPTPIPDPLRATGSIVYSLRQNGRENLWVRGIGLSDSIRLTNTPTDDRDPAWSPDGARIAFTSRREGQWDLYLIEVATGQVTRLTNTENYDASPSWSPDGKFIAFESYVGGNLDIYLIGTDGKGEPQRVTRDPAPDFNPAWSPLGREIAYVSLREGSAQIYVISLDAPYEDRAIRLTSNPQIEVGSPAWSPDGKTVAFSGTENGIDLVFAKPLSNPAAEPTVIGRGRQPAWSPDGASLLFALDSGKTTTFVGGLPSGAGVSALAFALPTRANHPHWTKNPLPLSLLESGGVKGEDAPLYQELVADRRDRPPYYQFRTLESVKAPLALLSDRVDESFVKLRQAALAQMGYDFLGTLQDALWSSDRPPEPGQTRQSWHYTGRAISFVRNLVFSNAPNPAPVEIVREDIGANTYWRVYVRVEESAQNGRLGEPLKRIPWDVTSRTDTTDLQAFEQGGRPKKAVPTGYYVDFTQLAEDYGWERIPADRSWRSVFGGMNYWEFNKREGLTWNDAMLELYAQSEIDAFLFGPTAVPTRTPAVDFPTPGGLRTATPIPPD